MKLPRSHPRPTRADAGHRAELPDTTGLLRIFSKLHAQAESSDHVFGSPLGSVRHGERSFWLPRFAYFGPHFSDASVRLAIYAGLDGSDLRPTQALVGFIEKLILKPDLGPGVHLTLFPLVNPSGADVGRRENARGGDLTRAHWNLSHEPEIELIAGDARVRGYHGFVRLESAPISQLAAVLRSGSRMAATGDRVLVPPAPVHDPFPVRWVVDDTRPVTSGPLTLADDLPNGPFELTLLVPNLWTESDFCESAMQVLRRFVVHFRDSYAYGIHL